MTEDHRRAAGRQGAWLFFVAGLLTLANSYVLATEQLETGILNAVSLAAIAVGGAAWLAPWHRWPDRALLIPIALALVLVALGNTYGGGSDFSYAVYFVVAFMYVGLAQPPRTAFLVAPFAALAYLAPEYLGHPRPYLVQSVTVAIPVCVLVAEVLARHVRRLHRANEESAQLTGLLAEAQRVGRLGSWQWDIASDQVSWSEELYRIFGLGDEGREPSYEGYLALIHPDDAGMVQERIASALERGTTFRFEHRVLRPGGEVGWVQSCGEVVRDGTGVPVRMRGTALDITAFKRTELALEEATARYRLLETMASAANEASSIDEALQVAAVAICTHTGWPVGHAYRCRPRTRPGVPGSTGSTDDAPSRPIWHVADAERLGSLPSAMDAEGPGAAGGEEPAHRVSATGVAAWIPDVASSFPEATRLGRLGVRGAVCLPVRVGGEVAAILEFFSDAPIEHDQAMLDTLVKVCAELSQVVERQVASEELATARDAATHQAFHDPLTGLANRALLEDRLRHALARRRRLPSPLAVLVLDLDGFKTINDSLGHAAGDRVLLEVGRRLQACTRGDDTAARLGGDEFAVLLEQTVEIETMAMVDRILDAIRRPIDIKARQVSVDASIGISTTRGAESTEELLRNADLAMYAAKAAGKGRAEIFRPELHEAAVRRQVLEADLRQALQQALVDEQFSLLYQPKVSLPDERITGVEALIRWQHPERGVVSPGEFIPVAEETGMIVPIGDWVLEQACRASARWAATPGCPPLVVSLNVSARQFGPELVERVVAVLAETGADPASICLEVTESAVMQDVEAASATLGELKALGVKLSIDDFGTGHSSLSYLKQFPLDELKIDRSFVEGLGRVLEDTAIVATIIGMANALDLTVVAEGVETREQLTMLESLGCAFAQGFYFSPARPFHEMDSLLAAGVTRRLSTEADDAGGPATPGELVLVVDDAPDVLLVNQMILRSAGFEVHDAESGEAALALASVLRPDCVLLDLSLPGIGGVEVCRALRADPAMDQCTIVMLTSSGDALDKVGAFSVGADDYVVKPAAPSELLGRVRSAIRRRGELNQAGARP